MNTLKKVLIFYFILHVSIMLILGFSSFSHFSDDVTYKKLNSFGKSIVDKAVDYKSSQTIVDFIFLYSIYTGTNRGFSFFSPNVAASKVKIKFISNEKEVTLPFLTQELDLKFRCLNSHFNSNIFDIEERETILKSISSYIFSNNKNIEVLDVYLNIEKYPSISIAQEIGNKKYSKNILAFSITKKNFFDSKQISYSDK